MVSRSSSLGSHGEVVDEAEKSSWETSQLEDKVVLLVGVEEEEEEALTMKTGFVLLLSSVRMGI